MNQVSEHIRQANQSRVDTLATVADTALGAVERIAALNLSIARRLLAQQESGSRHLLAARDIEALFSMQAKAILEDTKQMMNYSQRALEISIQTGDEISRVLSLGFSAPGKKAA